MAETHKLNAFGNVADYTARCPWCASGSMFVHVCFPTNFVMCDACGVQWNPLDEDELFKVHADKLAVVNEPSCADETPANASVGPVTPT